MTKTIIFTDLDGTLLHPKTYSFQEATSALELIRERDIPLILCSSKTKAEMEVYRKRLKNKHPFIVENGGGIYLPMGYFPCFRGREKGEDYIVCELGKTYEEIRRTFISLRESLRVSVKGFGDMTIEEIAALTGLEKAEATLAQQREFEEPFIFEMGLDERFLKAIEERGLKWTIGNLYHLMGDYDKGKAVRHLKRWYEGKYGKFITIGLGDGLNDLPLLKEVDYAVLIQKEDGSYDAQVELPNLIEAQGIGPAGWNKAVLELMNI
jgi:mannosyl-3-phosphoglycerate phosphatase family protein